MANERGTGDAEQRLPAMRYGIPLRHGGRRRGLLVCRTAASLAGSGKAGFRRCVAGVPVPGVLVGAAGCLRWRMRTGVAMRLMDKMLAVSAGILFVLVLVLTLLFALSFRQFSIYTAERHVRSVAEAVKVGLTESMINGTIGKRQ